MKIAEMQNLIEEYVDVEVALHAAKCVPMADRWYLVLRSEDFSFPIALELAEKMLKEYIASLETKLEALRVQLGAEQ